MHTDNTATNKMSSCAIVVSYNPDIEVLLSLLRQIGEQSDFLLVDNNSTNIHGFEAQCAAVTGCIGVEKQSENSGLASAINLGLRRAMQLNYRFALLFDQDSELGEAFFSSMHNAWLEAQQLSGPAIAAIGPRIENPENGRCMPFKRFDRFFARSDSKPVQSGSLYYTDFLISSGTLLALDNLSDIGLMKDDYFIDNVDLEWCFRAHSKGYALYGTSRATLHHRIGEVSTNILVRQGMMVKHSPLRAYYSTRNRINLYSKSYAPKQWKIRDFFRFLLKCSWLLIFSAERAAYWKNIRRGISDAKALT
jgi:rhamnosyltransferase